MFDNEHHNRIFNVLKQLKAPIFHEVGAFFGGGTLVTLLHGEYRWSEDIDFICPVGVGYHRLRELVAEASFHPSIFFESEESLRFPRDMKADQYGVRFLVESCGAPIKFEIVAESRICLESPEMLPWLDVPCLSRVDRYAEKLLANADRWLDKSIMSRDLIDLAILRLYEGVAPRALQKAEAAYPVLSPLKKAVIAFQESKEIRARCFNALDIRTPSNVLDGIDLLANDLGL